MKSLCLLAALPLLLATAPIHTQAAPLGVNLIVGNDAESGTTAGWNGFAGTPLFETASYAAPLFLFPDAPHGSRLFVGSHDGLSAGWQTLDVSGNAAAIDLGYTGFQLSAYLGGVGDQEDNTLLYVSFLDAAGNEIDHTELGPVYVDLRAFLTVLGGFRTEGLVPGGTRAIQFNLSMDAPDGDSSGAFADNLGFVLNSVPEPASWALVALGLAAAAATSSKSSKSSQARRAR